MGYNVLTGDIQGGVKYKVIGTRSVVYNTVTYAQSSIFVGVQGINSYTFTGAGTEEVNELLEVYASGLEGEGNGVDLPNTFPETTLLNGFGVEVVQNGADIIFNEITTIMGFGIEYDEEDYCVTEIVERRL